MVACLAGTGKAALLALLLVCACDGLQFSVERYTGPVSCGGCSGGYVSFLRPGSMDAGASGAASDASYAESGAGTNSGMPACIRCTNFNRIDVGGLETFLVPGNATITGVLLIALPSNAVGTTTMETSVTMSIYGGAASGAKTVSTGDMDSYMVYGDATDTWGLGPTTIEASAKVNPAITFEFVCYDGSGGLVGLKHMRMSVDYSVPFSVTVDKNAGIVGDTLTFTMPQTPSFTQLFFNDSLVGNLNAVGTDKTQLDIVIPSTFNDGSPLTGGRYIMQLRGGGDQSNEMPFALGCGDGIKDAPWEECDNPGSDCCNNDCTIKWGVVCRGAAGDCDVAEVCDDTVNGECPTDVFVRAGTTCRPSEGPCDRPEVCAGNLANCPADGKYSASRTCGNSCFVNGDGQTCDGVSNQCPGRREEGFVCRASRGPCDPPEMCTGLIDPCPADVLHVSGYTCQEATLNCTYAECDGLSISCPTDCNRSIPSTGFTTTAAGTGPDALQDGSGAVESEDDGTTMVIVGVVGGVGFLLCVVVVALLVVISRRKSGTKRLPPPEEPDFTAVNHYDWGTATIPKDVNKRLANYAPISKVFNQPPKMELAMACIASCPPTESDVLARALVYVTGVGGCAEALLCAAIDAEVDRATELNTLFRQNSLVTKLWQAFTRQRGMSYLWGAVGKEVAMFHREQLAAMQADAESGVDMESGGRSTFELDPNKMSAMVDEYELDVNKYLIMAQSQKFLSNIFRSSPDCPIEMRRVCRHVFDAAESKWEGSGQMATCALLFLRFFCPPLCSPESVGMLDACHQDVRRHLVMVASIIQNLANEVLFGKKTPHLAPLNDFITSNQPKLTAMIKQLVDVEKTPPVTPAYAVPDHVEAIAHGALVQLVAQASVKDSFRDALDGVPAVADAPSTLSSGGNGDDDRASLMESDTPVVTFDGKTLLSQVEALISTAHPIPTLKQMTGK